MTPHQILPRLKFVDYTMADPGNAGTIVPDRQFGVVRLITAAAETRTVAAPTKSGLVFTINMVTDGGDATVTVTGGYNEVGTTSIVFTDIGQVATFRSVEQTSGTFVWRLVESAATQAALTAQLTTITIADAAGTPDYALSALTTTTPYGLATAAEAISLLYVIQNLQVRLAEVESRLEVAGIVVAN